MDIQSIIYFMFAAVLLASAIAVVTVPNPVHSALFLIVSFFSAAGIWIMLQAEFLGILLILVYVGAVMVLFLFVVMMLNLNTTQKREGFKKTLALAVSLGALIVVQMGSVIFSRLHRPSVSTVATDLSIEGSNTRKIGKSDMRLNAATPHIEVHPETYEVRADGQLLTCEPAAELPLAQRYFLF